MPTDAAMMTLCLISTQQHVGRVCREVLATLPPGAWRIVQSRRGNSAPAELYVWDLEPDEALPRETDCPPGAMHVLLLEQKHVESIHRHLALPAMAVVLKPVETDCLKALLGLFVHRCDLLQSQRISLGPDAERQPDELLQCLLHVSLEMQQFHANQINFLARALHDFRSPLTATAGYCSLLLSGGLGPLNDRQRETIERMQHSLDRLSRMTSDTFRLSAAQAHPSEPSLEPADIETCIGHALNEVVAVAEAKSIALSAESAAPAGRLDLDRGQIEQVLVNLLENACKFASRHGSIQVRSYSVSMQVSLAGCAARGATSSAGALDAYRIDVLDSGPGIPAERLQRIFEPYTQYSGSQDRAGSGLGLAICKMIVEAHGGRIFAEARRQGAKFSLLLPFAEKVRQAESAQTAARPARVRAENSHG